MSASAITYRLVVSYRGEHFHGVAPQPGFRTVAGVLTDALEAAASEKPAAMAYAARTDKGVDARMNIFSFRLRNPLGPLHLPPDLRVVDVKEVPRSYHARNSSTSKRYRYRLLYGSHPRAWTIGVPLDLDVMRTLAEKLTGTHDFTALRHPRCEIRSTVRTIHAITIRSRGPLVVIDVEGDGFLRQQVRILVGTLASTAAGWLTIDGVMDAMARRDRKGTGLTAPAHGLTLMRVTDAIPRRDRGP